MLVLRRTRHAMIALAILVVGGMLFQARGALGPFVLGGVLAYALAPLVERVARLLPLPERRKEVGRTIAILIVYVAGAGVLTAVGLLIIPPLISEGSHLLDNIPQYSRTAQERVQEWNQLYRERVPADIQERINAAAQRYGQSIGAIAGGALNSTFRVTRTLFSVVLGYIIIPFWLFYVLKDRHKIGPVVESWFPPTIRADVDACIEIVRRVLGSYIRAQVTLGLFIGTVTTIGLWLLGVPFFIILGLIAGVAELIPIIGPILGAIPALIVVVATDPGRFWWVLVFYTALQQVENAVLVPRIQGQAVSLHPTVIILLLVVAQQLAGFLGMLVVVPLAAVSRDLWMYVYRRLREREAELAARQASRDGRAPDLLSADGHGAFQEAEAISAAGSSLPGRSSPSSAGLESDVIR